MAAGDIVQAVAWADFGTDTITVSSSQGSPSTWATPTSGNTIVVVALTDSGISTAPSGFSQVNGGGTGPYAYMYRKTSAGTETTISTVFTGSDDNAMHVYEIEGTCAYDTGPSVANTASATSLASGSSGTLSGSTSIAIVGALAWDYGEDITFDSGYTTDLNDTATSGTTPYTGSGYKALTGTTATSTTASWTNSAAAVIVLGVFTVSSVVNATPTPDDLIATGTFDTPGLSVGAGPADLAVSATFDTATIAYGAGPQPSALDSFAGFPTAMTSVTQDATATPADLTGSVTFDAVTTIAINGEVVNPAALTVPAQFDTPTVTGVINASGQPTTLAGSSTFDAATVANNVHATVTSTVFTGSMTFPATTQTTTQNANAAGSALLISGSFPYIEAVARDLTYYYNDDVQVSVEIAFGDYPLIGSPVWTDIGDDVRSFTISRGRQSELDEYKAGVATVLIDANQGDYDPTYSGSPYYPNVVPMRQIRIRASYGGTTWTLFRGFVETWPMQIKGHTDETVTIKAVDGLKILQAAKDSTPQVEENSATRVGNLLDEAGWPAGLRTLGTGIVTVPAYTPDCGSVLNLIRDIKDSEAGQFFIAANGNATFRNRTYRSGLTSQATFGDGTGEIPYQDIRLAYDDAQIWNRIEVQVFGFPSFSSSTASQDKYGIRQLTVNGGILPNSTDGDDLADVYLARYKDPKQRLESVTFKPEAAPAQLWPHILGRDLGEKVTVIYRTNAGNTKALVSYIESISHKVSPQQRWTTTWTLSQYL